MYFLWGGVGKYTQCMIKQEKNWTAIKQFGLVNLKEEAVGNLLKEVRSYTIQ